MPSVRSTRSNDDSSLYRRVWRWHFYAGLICLPFLALLAVTGALYLYKDPIESVVYSRLLFVDESVLPYLDAESILEKAKAAEPGEIERFTAPLHTGRSAEVSILTKAGSISVFLDPTSGKILGRLSNELKLMEIVKRTHSLMIAGPLANYWIEVVAGWAIVLVVSGFFLWWPRGQRGGVYSLRTHSKQRTWWRDLHAVTGTLASTAILFLAVTGMLWSAFWGKEFSRLTNEWGIGAPKYLWERPSSSQPLGSSGSMPWVLTKAPIPASDPHAHHSPESSTIAGEEALPQSIGLNKAVAIFKNLGVPETASISLPARPSGVYRASAHEREKIVR